jgi:hypothetical protein
MKAIGALITVICAIVMLFACPPLGIFLIIQVVGAINGKGTVGTIKDMVD